MVTDWDHRELCPDGGCVGVIGADGTCKTCGRAAPNWGDERTRGLLDPVEDADDDDGDAADAADDPAAAIAAASRDEDRRLCPDGACIGLIGPDGRCKACGTIGVAGLTTPAAAAPVDDDALDAAADALAGVATTHEVAQTGALADAATAPDDRTLCPDGACIGVIGPDGRCKVCGKDAA